MNNCDTENKIDIENRNTENSFSHATKDRHDQKVVRNKRKAVGVRKYHQDHLLHNLHHHRYQDSKKNSVHNESVLDVKTTLTGAKIAYKENKSNYKVLKKDYKKKHAKAIPTSVLTIVFVAIAALLSFTVMWLFRTWPKLQMDELIYQMTAPLTGTGSSMITNYILQAALPTVAIAAAAATVIIVTTKKGVKIRKFAKKAMTVFSVLCLLISAITFNTRLDIGNYINNQTTVSDFIEDEYVDPNSVELTFPETKRNLIYIYLESMEVTYTDKNSGGAFDDDVIPELTKLAKENESFSDDSSVLDGGYSLPGTTWTMGGLFGSSSGLPLKSSLTDNNWNSMSTQDSFYPTITTLGDILEENGYQQEFLCGSDATFGGRQLYYETHGNYTIHDYKYAVENGLIPEDYYVWWGYEDSKLIEFAKNDLTEMAASGQPFNLTMLTVDTHFEDGYVCDQCEDEWGNQYSDVMSCSSRQITSLIEWIQEQSWYENTTIILSGDHPTMDSDYLNDIDSEYQRKVYTAYINADAEKEDTSYRTYSTLDNFPTSLAALGVDIEGDRLGLGTNLFSSTATLTEKYGLDKEASELSKKSTFMETVADIQDTDSYIDSESSLSMCATVRLENYNSETQKAELSVDSVFTLASGDLIYLTADVEQADGSYHTYRAKQQKSDGKYIVEIDVPNGDPTSVHIILNAHVDKGNGDLLTIETVFDYTGSLLWISSSQNDFVGMLKEIDQIDKNRYAVLITSQGDALAHLTDSYRSQLIELGMTQKTLSNEYDCRMMLIDGNGIQIKTGNGYIRMNGLLSNGEEYVIASAAAETGATSSIILNWEEHSQMTNGFNISIYDMETGSVVCDYSYETESTGPEADITADFNASTGDLSFTLTNVRGISLGTERMRLIVYNKTDITHRKIVYLSSQVAGTWTGSENFTGVSADDLYAVAYSQTGLNMFTRFETPIEIKTSTKE